MEMNNHKYYLVTSLDGCNRLYSSLQD